MADWVNVAKTSEAEESSPIHIEIDGVRIMVVKLQGIFYAIENICTHDGGELSGGCIEEDRIICPRHGARFSVKTGEALSAPAYEAVATFPVRVEDGIVQVRDDRWD